MNLDDGLRLIHEPARLQIMALLAKHRDISYTGARETLGLTDGNLAAHVKRLEAAGFVVARRALAGDRFEVRYRITRLGADEFARYVATLKQFLP